MRGVRLERNGHTVLEYDFAEVAKVDGTTLNVNFVTPKPIQSGDLVKVGFVRFSPEELYGGTKQATLDGWRFLVSKGVDLAGVFFALTHIDLTYAYIGDGHQRIHPAIPLVVSLGRLACNVNRIMSLRVKGNSGLPVIVRRRLNGCARSFMDCLTGKAERTRLTTTAGDVHEKVSSLNSELSLTLRIHQVRPDIEINTKHAGPDFVLRGKAIHRVEVARRLGGLNIKAYEEWAGVSQQDPKLGTIPFHPIGLTASLALEVLDRLDEELRQGDLVIFDVSTTFDGITMAAAKASQNTPGMLDFEVEFKKAIAELEQGRKAMLFFSEANGAPAAMFVPASNVITFAKEVNSKTELAKLRRRNPYIFQMMFNEALAAVESLPAKQGTNS